MNPPLEKLRLARMRIDGKVCEAIRTGNTVVILQLEDAQALALEIAFAQGWLEGIYKEAT